MTNEVQCVKHSFLLLDSPIASASNNSQCKSKEQTNENESKEPETLTAANERENRHSEHPIASHIGTEGIRQRQH